MQVTCHQSTVVSQLRVKGGRWQWQGRVACMYAGCGSILRLIQFGIFFCFIFIIIYHHTPEQRKIPNVPRVKFNHKIYPPLSRGQERDLRLNYCS